MLVTKGPSMGIAPVFIAAAAQVVTPIIGKITDKLTGNDPQSLQAQVIAEQERQAARQQQLLLYGGGAVVALLLVAALSR